MKFRFLFFSFVPGEAHADGQLNHFPAARANNQSSGLQNYAFADIEINFAKHQITKARENVELSPREIELLKFFIVHRGETVTREQLLDGVWGMDAMTCARTVDIHVARLRQKIEDDPENLVLF